MRKVIAMIVAVILLGIGGVCFAGNTAQFTVKANVTEVLELDYWVRWAHSSEDVIDTSVLGGKRAYWPDEEDGVHSGLANGDLDFEVAWKNVSDPDDSSVVYAQYFAKKYYTVFLVPRTSGRPYEISQSCDGFTNTMTGNSLPKALVMVPDYQVNDKIAGFPQGAKPSVDKLGIKAYAVVGAPGNLIYDGNAGKSRIIRCYYGLATGNSDPVKHPITDPDATAQIIGGDTLPGTYSGTVTFTMTQR